MPGSERALRAAVSVQSATALNNANTQGETLEEARENLTEAAALVLEANRQLAEQSLEGAEVIRETLVLPAA